MPEHGLELVGVDGDARVGGGGFADVFPGAGGGGAGAADDEGEVRHRVAPIGAGIGTAVIGTIITALLLLAPESPNAEHRLFLPAIVRQPTSLKRGLATHHPEVQADVGLLGATWRYNWLADIPTAPGVESVPMIYSAGVMRLLANNTIALGGDSPYVLGFNEPDRPDQLLSPQDAVDFWVVIEGMYPDRLLVSPAPSHLDPGWLRDFRAAYIAKIGRPPRLDALAIHCYFRDDDTIRCRAIIEQFVQDAEEWGAEGVWVTEFAPIVRTGTTDEKEARAFVQWLEENPGVTRYAWFPTRLDGSEYWNPDPDDWALLVDEGGLTRWGHLYVENRNER